MIFTDKDRLQLKEADTFTQFLLKGEKDLYTIDFQFEENVEKVYLDVIVFSGDVNVTMEDEVSKIIAFKYFLSNKIFYSIHILATTKKIDFKVRAHKNSFYLVQHQLVKDITGSGDSNHIESGVNYIQSISAGADASYRKSFYFKNLKFDTQTPFLVNFYSQNCQFGVTREIPDEPGNIQSIEINDNYGQIIKYMYELNSL